MGVALRDGERTPEAEQRDPRSRGGADTGVAPIEPVAARAVNDTHGHTGGGGRGPREGQPGQSQHQRRDRRDGLVHPDLPVAEGDVRPGGRQGSGSAVNARLVAVSSR